MEKIEIVIGIDPSTGSKSKCALVAFDPELGIILDVKEFGSPSPDLRTRMKQIIIQLAAEFKFWEANQRPYAVFIESTVMQGKGGESLQRMIGAIMAIAPANRSFDHVSNMQIKAYVGRTGKADKEQVAEGLKKFFPNDPTLPDIIRAHRWDITDALAVGVTGYEKFVTKSILQTKPKPKIRLKKAK